MNTTNLKVLTLLMAVSMYGVGCTNENSTPDAQPSEESQAAIAEDEQSQGEAVQATEVKIEWLTDFEAAKKESVESGKHILADFSGSDWCGWCIKLDNEVFSKKAFQAYAGDNLVLFLADFPSKKQLPEATKAQNEALAEKYGIRGFPTVLILDAEGKVLAKTGYQHGGPEAYVTHLKELIGGRTNDESTEEKAGT